MTGPVVRHKCPNKRRIAILTAAPLSSNPRAFKEAETVARAGFEVVVYGACFDAGQRKADEELAGRHGFSFKSVMSVGEDRSTQRLLSVWPRVRTRVGVELNRYLHIESALAIGLSGC